MRRSFHESQVHRVLKRLAAEWLMHRGCTAAAVEVHGPRERWWVDAAGYRHTPTPATIIIECKQSRGDLLRDAQDGAMLFAQRQRIRDDHRDLVGLSARRAFLFDDMDEGNLMAAMTTTSHRVADGTRFHAMASGQVSDRLYLCVPPDIMDASEVPPGWGMLEAHGESLIVRHLAPTLSPRPADRDRLLRHIASALSRSWR